MPMRIYVDFDDVLCETARHLTGLARDMFGRRVAYEEIAVFDLRQAFALSASEIDDLMEHAHRTEFLAGISPAPGGVETVRALADRGHELTVVTGRPAASHDGSNAWLRKHGLGHLDLLHVDKYGRAGPEPRDGHPRALDMEEFSTLCFDAAIEDAPAALDLLAPRRECAVIIYDRPWNRQYRTSGNMRRAESWREINEMIGSLVMG
ncbi:MAG: 2-dehydropantoate 2-reductase [Kiritimatiellae bacterium]|nr:2-dehydropantoate 2-reductase [Kiritimatiellia bacterium]